MKAKNIYPDPIYNNRLVSQFINRVMKSGKKSLAQRLVYNALSMIKDKGSDPLATFQRAINNTSPRVEVRSRRVGGASYQVPAEVRGTRKVSLAIRWIISAANSRSNKEFKTFAEKLFAEIMAASKNEGEAVKRKETTHKMAEANRVFSHFRW